MPLWTTTRVPVPSRWGWAFSSVGRPWVAQRVWPMPKVPWMGLSAMTVSRLRSLPGARRSSRPCGAAGDGDAGGVVAAVFEAAKAFNDDGDDGLRTDVTDDSAHRMSLDGGRRILREEAAVDFWVEGWLKQRD